MSENKNNFTINKNLLSVNINGGVTVINIRSITAIETKIIDNIYIIHVHIPGTFFVVKYDTDDLYSVLMERWIEYSLTKK